MKTVGASENKKGQESATAGDDNNGFFTANEKIDFSNAKILYEALQGHINLVQASDLRLWAYMAHKQHWDYMHTRLGSDLPDDEDEAEEN